MHEEYDSILSTPAEDNKIGRFGCCLYIGKTQIQYIGQMHMPQILMYSLFVEISHLVSLPVTFRA